MSEQALAEGTAAFGRGLARTANPYDANSEDWMCWRDGFDQANAVSQRKAVNNSEHANDRTLVRSL